MTEWRYAGVAIVPLTCFFLMSPRQIWFPCVNQNATFTKGVKADNTIPRDVGVQNSLELKEMGEMKGISNLFITVNKASAWTNKVKIWMNIAIVLSRCCYWGGTKCQEQTFSGGRQTKWAGLLPCLWTKSHYIYSRVPLDSSEAQWLHIKSSAHWL